MLVVVGVCDSSCPEQSARRLTLADDDETGADAKPRPGRRLGRLLLSARAQATSDRYRLPLPAVQYQ